MFKKYRLNRKMAKIRAKRSPDFAERANATKKLRYGEDFYSRIGARGGAVSHPETRWFHSHRELVAQYGSKGGSISTRKGIKNGMGKK